MKKKNLAILIKSAYILLFTLLAFVGVTFATYNGFSSAWTGGNAPAPGGTLTTSHINELKTALDTIFSMVTIDSGSVTIEGDLEATGSICDDEGNCLETLPELECVTVEAVFSGSDWRNVNVYCDTGYQRTGCSMEYNDGEGGTWGTSTKPSGTNGCGCGSGMKTGSLTCYAYCCKIA